METKNLINIVVMTQQAKTYLYNNVDKDSLKLINTILIFKHKGTITDSWNEATFFNAAGYAILNKDAKLIGPNQPKEEPKKQEEPKEELSKQEELLKFLEDKGFYNTETKTYEISTSKNPIDFGDNNVYFGNIKTKGSLFQDCQEVGNILSQNYQKVGNDLLQDYQKVGKNLHQGNQEVGNSLLQDYQKVGKNLWQDCQKVGETLYQECQDVKGDLFQDHQDVKGKTYQDALKGEKNNG